MKFTIDTNLKTIQISGSFKFDELDSLIKQLPKDWRGFAISIEPTIIEKNNWYYPYQRYPYWPSWQYSQGDNILLTANNTGGNYGHAALTVSDKEGNMLLKVGN